MLFLVTLAVKAQRARAGDRDAACSTRSGRRSTPIEPGGTGSVRTHGEIWTATADEPIAGGQRRSA